MITKRHLLLLLPALALATLVSSAQTKSVPDAIESYVQPYVDSMNFSGVVLVREDDKVIFEKSYGFANREQQKKNTAETQFHIASVSMQFTAAAVLRLVDSGELKLSDTVDRFVPVVEGADKITIRDLLIQRSGLPDINGLPDYDQVLQEHQTPASLVKKIEGRPLLFDPGTKYLHEEHSAYNLLALIVEKKTGLPFAAALERLVFKPLGLASTGVDDDFVKDSARLARGYEPVETSALAPGKTIHWSGKTGNASVYTTAPDLAKWVHALFNGRALTATSRDEVLDTSVRVGYGWFRGENKRLGRKAYYMNGRAPGFASFVCYLPERKLTVIVLSNIYSSATSTIGYDIAALTLGLPYKPLTFRKTSLNPKELQSCTGEFQFGPDFFVPNGKVSLTSNGRELSLRWPDGSRSPLIPLDPDHFVDRAYWEEVRIERDPSGNPSSIVYSDFRGKALPQ